MGSSRTNNASSNNGIVREGTFGPGSPFLSLRQFGYGGSLSLVVGASSLALGLLLVFLCNRFLKRSNRSALLSMRSFHNGFNVHTWC